MVKSFGKPLVQTKDTFRYDGTIRVILWSEWLVESVRSGGNWYVRLNRFSFLKIDMEPIHS